MVRCIAQHFQYLFGIGRWPVVGQDCKGAEQLADNYQTLRHV
jgi:hypothetical protein